MNYTGIKQDIINRPLLWAYVPLDIIQGIMFSIKSLDLFVESLIFGLVINVMYMVMYKIYHKDRIGTQSDYIPIIKTSVYHVANLTAIYNYCLL